MNAIILTGSIATGKSTVASLLKLYGYSVISADDVAHKILKKHSNEIEKIFGTSHRKELGKIVFNDKKKKKELENFLHPKIKENILKKSNELEKYNIPYFLDIPLYFETGNYNEFKDIVVVYTPYEIQLQRLMQRNNISQDEAKKLINLQLPIEEKKEKASYVIDNSKDLKHLQKEVDEFIKYLKETK
jgi:dephospho-CoA kinase